MIQRAFRFSLCLIYASTFFFNLEVQSAFAFLFDGSECSNQCDFYLNALEKSVPCGADGYALSYGDKYCRRFKESESHLSPQGQIWSQNTRQCLIASLIPLAEGAEPKSTCQAIREAGFGSHSRCYTNDHLSICDLPPSDIEKIIGQMDFKDLTSKEGQRQIKRVVGTCVARLEKKLEAPFETIGNPDFENVSVQREGSAPDLRGQLTTWKSFSDKISYLEWFYGQQ